MFISAVKLGILTWRLIEIALPLESASSGHSWSCSFWHWLHFSVKQVTAWIIHTFQGMGNVGNHWKRSSKGRWGKVDSLKIKNKISYNTLQHNILNIIDLVSANGAFNFNNQGIFLLSLSIIFNYLFIFVHLSNFWRAEDLIPVFWMPAVIIITRWGCLCQWKWRGWMRY